MAKGNSFCARHRRPTKPGRRWASFAARAGPGGSDGSATGIPPDRRSSRSRSLIDIATLDDSGAVEIAATAGGGFAVAWIDERHPNVQIHLRTYDASGATVSGFVTVDGSPVEYYPTDVGLSVAGAFNTGTAATQADDRIVYDSASGALLFDADGLGGAAGVQFATVAAGLALSVLDFIVI